jgi:multidrug efflux pump subunit AcrA (membrane-fusion protein)
VQAALETGQATTRYKVPSNAVIRSGDQTYVFVKVAEGYRVQPISVLATQEGESVISGDLHEGDTVAVSGIAAIKGAWKGIGGE